MLGAKNNCNFELAGLDFEDDGNHPWETMRTRPDAKNVRQYQNLYQFLGVEGE